jgi:hypothetical protein
MCWASLVHGSNGHAKGFWLVSSAADSCSFESGPDYWCPAKSTPASAILIATPVTRPTNSASFGYS